MWGGNHGDFLHGGSGNDTIQGDGGHDKIWGDGNNDRLYGNSGNDTIEGGSGNDTIDGGSGNDLIEGGTGNDVLEGGSGNDTIDGDSGTDTAVFDTNSDAYVDLWGGNASSALGTDSLISIERVTTKGGDDTVVGDANDNLFKLGSGHDLAYGFAGDDTMYGESGNDDLLGYEGEDVLAGSAGEDTLHGHQDDDTLYGGSNNDRLVGGEGDDDVYTGSGEDVVRWNGGDLGIDTIHDFDLAEDRLSFEAGFFAEDVGSNGVGLEDVLMVWNDGPDAWLAANTAAAGWDFIAHMKNVDAYQLGQMVENGNIISVSLTLPPLDVPIGFETIDFSGGATQRGDEVVHDYMFA